MKKYAILSNEGTACAETGICETCSSQRGVKNNIVKLAKIQIETFNKTV